MTTILFIAGSRIWPNPDQVKTYTERIVGRAYDLGWEILVGDCPVGVDRAIIDASTRYPFLKITCVGISAKPRAPKPFFGTYERFDVPYPVRPHQAYTLRDQHLASRCDRGLMIWNGSSPGTYKVYHYLITERPEVPVDLIKLSDAPHSLSA